ncbi:DUF1045 domain-containing protein [Ruegeria aquimaris]|uniref:DUF1045 domain-containing protein n=1 Tax=Ruegeria aquimaris TaxID=2984333 RepID=A0ABT3AGW5_9RHOB|nr:DUF1045 domain-containing protein [Ruegeria sp. XHP0148]MCV2887920.1 DUF1045 domain-containing protein [Ruegeria sp. XHP0148]
MTFLRYAIYFLPPASEAWARFGAAWLGWDVETGQELAHPEGTGLDVAALTATPRKYGLHATMKPPFRLAAGQDPEALHRACAALAARRPAVVLAGLEITRLGRFLALRPVGELSALNALAAACVTELDPFRAPATPQELERRRAARLSPAQDAHLERWGYPYVLDQFRFHITLTGRLDEDALAQAQALLQDRLGPLLPVPFTLADLALVGEAAYGRFHLIHRYALSL